MHLTLLVGLLRQLFINSTLLDIFLRRQLGEKVRLWSDVAEAEL